MQRLKRRAARLVLAVVVVAAGPVLSACDSLDSFEFFDTKKKLAGERKQVFPDGVPGVTSGVPPELVKGYREQEGGALDPAKAAAEAAAETAAKPKKPKAEPKPQRTASKPAPKPQPDPSAAPTRVAAPEPAQQPPPPQVAPWPVAQPPTAWPGSSPGTVAR
jgi:outer membrane biosynthesis protein TonB